MHAQNGQVNTKSPKRLLQKRLCIALLTALTSASGVAEDAAPTRADADNLLSWRDARSADLIVFDRADLDASGDLSVADFLRDLPQASEGNFRPQSGSAAQSVADIDLYAFGSQRTLVLLDGRPLTKSPLSSGVVNLNLVPLGMIESIDIGGFGGSSRYGEGATGGVVNLRTRKAFTGMQLEYGVGRPEIRGGDTETGTLLLGSRGDRGWVSAGVSFNRRDIVFARDDLGGEVLGATSFGNNFQVANAAGTAGQGVIRAMPGFACTGSGRGDAGAADLFYQRPGSAVCQYNFNAVSARDASSDTSGLFVRGEYEINDQWLGFLNSSVRRQASFGRYAPTPATLFVPEGSPNDPLPGDGRGAFLLHRFAAIGPRDTTIDETDRDLELGAQGQLADGLLLNVGIRDSNSQAYELGRNYVVTRLAEAAIRDGRYDVRDPFGASADVLAGLSATTSRDAHWHRQEAYAALQAKLFEAAGGTSVLDLRASWLRDDYADIYDSLQSAGEIQGSAGNSAIGQRIHRSLAASVALPVHKDWSLTLTARGDQFSDIDSEFSPGLNLAWQPLPVLGVEVGYERGFVLPSFKQRYGETSVSATSVLDQRTCLAQGGFDCSRTQVQVPTQVVSNPALESESTRQAYLGLRYQPWDWLDLRAVFRDIEVEDGIQQLGFQTAIFRDTLGLPPLPAVAVIRDPVTGALQRVETSYQNIIDVRRHNIDLQARGSFDWGRWGQFESSLLASHVESAEFTSMASDGSEFTSSTFFHLPDWRAQWQQRWVLGDFSLNASTHWIDGYGDNVATVRVGDYVTHDLQVSWQAPWQARISLGATNIGNRKPSLDSAISGYAYNSYLFDSYGRTLLVSYRQQF